MAVENPTEKFVFVYANCLNVQKDAFPRIASRYGGVQNVRREFIVNSPSVTAADVSYEGVRLRMDEIWKSAAPNEKVKVVLAGYSPLVAILHDVAREFGLEECYFYRDGGTGGFSEERLRHTSKTL